MQAEQLGESEEDDVKERKESKASKFDGNMDLKEASEMNNVDADDYLEKPLIDSLMRLFRM